MNGRRRDDPAARHLGLADLARSGLGVDDAKKLRIAFLSPRETYDHVGVAAPSYLIPSLDPLSVIERLNAWRIRLLGPSVEGAGRYRSSKGAALHLWCPPAEIGRVNWQVVAKDPGIPLVVVEGEKKAARCQKAGQPAVAIAGVDAWRTQRQGGPLLDFEQGPIVWLGRRVIIVFDSDAREKPAVTRALVGLTKMLASLGATPVPIVLPQGRGNARQGLDDWLEASNKPAGLNELEPIEMEEVRIVDTLNVENAYVTSAEAVWCERLRSFVSTQGFQIEYAEKVRIVTGISAKGEPKSEFRAKARLWIESPLRRTVDRTVLAPPGSEAVIETLMMTEDLNGGKLLNTWDPRLMYSPEPPPGKTQAERLAILKPFSDLHHRLFGLDPAVDRWVKCWITDKLRRPGRKAPSTVIVVGKQQGTGKSGYWNAVVKLFGKYGGHAQAAQIFEDKNAGWADGTVIVHVDELAVPRDVRFTDVFKSFISNPLINVEKKYGIKYSRPNTVDYVFSSNRYEVVNDVIEGDHDRRCLLHEDRSKPMTTIEAHEFFDVFMRTPKVSQWIAWWFLETSDMTGFDPLERPPATELKDRMRDESKPWSDEVVDDFVDNPSSFLSAGADGVEFRGDFISASDLHRILARSGVESPNPNDRQLHAVRHALARRMHDVWYMSNGIRVPQSSLNGKGRAQRDGNTVGPRRLYAFRNVERWRKATSEQRAEHWIKVCDPATRVNGSNNGSSKLPKF